MFSYGRQLHKSSNNQQDMPSFSSILLDEIYRSIDGTDGKPEDFKAYKERALKRQGGFKPKPRTTATEDKEFAHFRRARLVESWMRKEDDRKVQTKLRPPLFPELETKSLHDNDLMFFSSTSSSSDSSGALSSSDTEFFGPTPKTKISCFTTRPKPVRTGGSDRKTNPREDCSFFDDYQSHQKNRVAEDDLIKSKSRALKIYANLKKMKQPISPGGKLTTFINSLFSNANGKKSKNAESNTGFHNSKSSSSTTCSSASSFSRSCLSKYSPKSREKMREGIQRTVRFHPVSVIVDEDSRPCGHKCIYDEDGRPPLPPNEQNRREKGRKLEEASVNALKSYYSKRGKDDLKKILDQDDYDLDDGRSDSSSDLFELDHLAMFGDSRFCEELPVYETTYFDENRGLIC